MPKIKVSCQFQFAYRILVYSLLICICFYFVLCKAFDAIVFKRHIGMPLGDQFGKNLAGKRCQGDAAVPHGYVEVAYSFHFLVDGKPVGRYGTQGGGAADAASGF